MTSPLRLVVFDVDGTLIDSQNHIHGAMTAAFEHADLPAPAREATLHIVGLSLPVAVRRLAPNASDVVADRIVAEYRAAFGAIRNTVEAPLYPGALEALASLDAQAHTLMGVATGKSRRGLDHVLTRHDLARHFVTLQVADDHPSKPHPAMLEAALRETGTDARLAVMVGDTTYDMEMARNAGMRGIGVAWGYHAAEALLDAGAATVIDRFDALAGALGDIWENA